VAATFNLCAKPGTVTPAGAPGAIPIWGFATGACASATAGVPGPNLTVGAGDTVTLNVENSLDVPLHLAIPGITFTPTVGDSPKVDPGTTGHVRFTASKPGTYLYESDGTAGRQAEVGLAGALVVRSLTAGRAYDNASTAYNTEAFMVLSEIDPNLNATLTTPGALATFDMATWKPQYRLINGLAYPNTGTISSAANTKVLLRYVNTGSEHVSMTVLGADATVVGREGSLLTTPLGITAETIPDGGTADVLVSIPAGSASGSKFAVYDRNLNLVNGAAAGIGGRLRFIQVP
jgi:FtsP/CotA-like multicopper oxidase with cupredoxin domain